MLARVKQDFRWNIVIAFGGEFIKLEWREVPAEFEGEAKSHPFLEVKTDAPLVELIVEPEPVKHKKAGRK